MTTNMISKSMFEQKSYYEFRDLTNPVSNGGYPFHRYFSDVPIVIAKIVGLTEFADIGSTVVQVNTLDGLIIGMNIVIGSGNTADYVNIIGFGSNNSSILFDKPLDYTHEIGTPVIVKPAPVIDNSGCALSIITAEDLAALQYIELNYGQPMSNKNYEAIPSDYNKYIELYALIYGISQTTQDPKMLVLLKIVNEALQGAINAYTIFGDNLAFKLSNLNLQKQIDDILSNKNEHVVATASGQLSVTKKFTLAPVFNYYIVLYGMPVFGVGFDPLKINFLVGLLTRIGINPYK